MLDEKISDVVGPRRPGVRGPSLSLQAMKTAVGDRIGPVLTRTRLTSLSNLSMHSTDRATSSRGFTYSHLMLGNVHDVVKVWQ